MPLQDIQYYLLSPLGHNQKNDALGNTAAVKSWDSVTRESYSTSWTKTDLI